LGMMGDINQDYSVSVPDIVLTINYVIGRIGDCEDDFAEHSLNECFDYNQRAVANLDFNSVIDIIDLVGMINLILNPEVLSRSVTEMATVAISDNEIFNTTEGFVLYDITLSKQEAAEISVTDQVFASSMIESEDGTTVRLIVIDPEEGRMISSNMSFDVVSIIATNRVGYIEVEKDMLPSEFAITNAYPNPFNPEIKISYYLPNESDVSVDVYNINGQLVQNIHSAFNQSGSAEVVWNAREHSSGVYFVAVKSLQGTLTQKITLIK